MSAIEHALRAVSAANDGEAAAAYSHIAKAQQLTRAAARRERQLIEIAALGVAGQALRAAGLALEHTQEFPNDSRLLTLLVPADI